MTEAGLVIIDIQNDYFPGGRMELEGADEAGEKAALALQNFRRECLPVYHVRHETTSPGGTFFLPGTPGAEINSCVAPAAGEAVITKHHPSAFRETDLETRLRDQGIRHLVFAGMMTHMCIDTSIHAAYDLGFRCTLLHDATATRSLAWNGEIVPAPQVQAALVAALGQPFARVVDTKMFSTENF